MSSVRAIAVYCDGPPDNEGNPTHERFYFGRYEKFIPAPVPPGTHCLSCSEPLDRRFLLHLAIVSTPLHSWMPPLNIRMPQWAQTGCEHCGLAEIIEHTERLSNLPFWGFFERWNDNGRIRRTRGHNRYVERGGDAQPRVNVRFNCGRCSFDEQRRGWFSTRRQQQEFDRLAEDGIAEISVRDLIGLLR